MKKAAIGTLVLAFGFLVGASAGRSATARQYPLAGVVTEIDKGGDVVTFADGAGNLWSFFGTEDWTIGDTVAAIMDTNGTETVADDVIVSVRYAG